MKQRIRLADGSHHDFTWGPVAAVHSINGIDLIEFNWGKSWSNAGDPAFHIYVDGKDAGMSAPTLDEALVFAIAYRYEGCNSRAGGYFIRMIRQEKESSI